MGTTTTLVTVREFLQRPESESLLEEVIGGEIASMPRAGYPHEVTKSNVMRLVTAWSHQNPGWRFICEASYQLDNRNCLIPPGSTGVFQGAPEIAIEVVSSEPAARLERKIRLYLDDQPLVDAAVLSGFSIPTSAIFESV